MWNVEIVPCGYKKLVINPKEVEIVRFIYETYVTTGSLFKTYDEFKQRGIKDRRCTKTFKMDWLLCSVRQDNANRLENFIFRLNNDPESGYCSGNELMEECSPFSSQTLQNILKIILKSTAQQKGIERNLLIKKFIKIILYSKEQIQINLYYSEDLDTFKNSNILSGVGSGGEKKEKGTPVSISKNPQFVLLKMATHLHLHLLKGNAIHLFPGSIQV